jgi:hypothetical protein
MLNVISGRELAVLVSRIMKYETNPTVISCLTARIFFRCKQTSRVVKARKMISDFYYSCRYIKRSRCILRKAISLGMSLDYKIEPCEQIHCCFHCKQLVCSADHCINEEHNASFEFTHGVTNCDTWCCGEDECADASWDLWQKAYEA